MSRRFFDDTRDAVWVTGTDAVSFLHGLLSQDLEGMSDGEVRRSFLLGPQGKLRALLWVARLAADRILLVSDRGSGETVASDLLNYRIRVKVEVVQTDETTWEAWGAGVAADSGLNPGNAVERGPGVVLAPLELDVVIGVGAAIPADWERGDFDELTAARIGFGEPAYGIDVDENTIPQETGLVTEAVSFEKGCYLGQELVARIDSRGHVNRHLRRLRLEQPGLDLAGGEIVADEKVVGSLTSVASSAGGAMGLGMVRREIEPGSRVVVRTNDVEVVAEVLERA